jgi:hypothetical protein
MRIWGGKPFAYLSSMLPAINPSNLPAMPERTVRRSRRFLPVDRRGRHEPHPSRIELPGPGLPLNLPALASIPAGPLGAIDTQNASEIFSANPTLPCHSLVRIPTLKILIRLLTVTRIQLRGPYYMISLLRSLRGSSSTGSMTLVLAL